MRRPTAMSYAQARVIKIFSMLLGPICPSKYFDIVDQKKLCIRKIKLVSE